VIGSVKENVGLLEWVFHVAAWLLPNKTPVQICINGVPQEKKKKKKE
jgi:hypothetical protein